LNIFFIIEKLKNYVINGDHYLKIYEEKFKSINPKNILEIGFDSGGFLEILAEKYPEGNIYGYDTNLLCKNINFDNDRIKIFVGDELDSKNINILPDNLDIIIDDSHHNPITNFNHFELLFKKMSNKSIFIIEDYENYYTKKNRIINFEKRILDMIFKLNSKNKCQYLYKIELYDNLIVIHKRLKYKKNISISGNEYIRFPNYFKKYFSKNINFNKKEESIIEDLNNLSYEIYKNK